MIETNDNNTDARIKTMTITYLCQNKSCKNDDGKPFSQAFSSESYMDDKNIATVYCPRCHQRMVKSENQPHH
jgi:hypothetical protein